MSITEISVEQIQMLLGETEGTTVLYDPLERQINKTIKWKYYNGIPKVWLWTAKNLKDLYQLTVLPEIICIQETWLHKQLDFVNPGYKLVRKDKIGSNGGVCETFVKNGVAFREIILHCKKIL